MMNHFVAIALVSSLRPALAILSVTIVSLRLNTRLIDIIAMCYVNDTMLINTFIFPLKFLRLIRRRELRPPVCT